MNRQLFRGAVLAIAATLSPMVYAQDALQGDEKLACEALLCLAASTRPAECAPSIRRYFSISYRKFWKTLQGRLDFLNLCPVVTTQPNMANLKNALVNGAGRCDAASINQASYISSGEGEGYVQNVMPDYCTTYYGHGLIQGQAPLYVGTPAKGGHWVEAVDYPQALAAYNQRLAQEAAAAAAAAQGAW